MALSGCLAERSYSPEEQAAEEARIKTDSANPNIDQLKLQREKRRAAYRVASPIYTAPIDVVQDAVVRACKQYYDHIDKDDRAAHRVQVEVDTVWAGNSMVTVTMSEREDGKTMASILSDGEYISAAWNNRCARDVSKLASFIDQQMSGYLGAEAARDTRPAMPTPEERLQGLQRLHDKGLLTDDEYAAKRKEIVDGL